MGMSEDLQAIQEFHGALGAQGVTDAMVRGMLSDPARVRAVAAALRGELEAPMTPQQWFDRELAAGRVMAEHGLHCFREDEVERASAMTIGLNHHFVPDGVGACDLIDALYNITEVRMDRNFIGREWWRRDSEKYHLPTTAGILYCDLGQMMRSATLDSKPFNLTYAEQRDWADGEVTSVEQTLFLILLSVLTESRLPWYGTRARCRNVREDSHMEVVIDCFDGLGLSCGGGWDPTRRDIGAIPAIFQPLDDS